MTNFDNKKIPNSAEETDMELTLDNLDGVSGGVGESSGEQQEKRLPQPDPGIAPVKPEDIIDSHMSAGRKMIGRASEVGPTGGGFSVQRYKTEYK